MNAAAVLSEAGFKVDIYSMRFCTGDHIPPAQGVNVHYLGTLKKGIGFRLGLLIYTLKVAFKVMLCRYRWVFAYNMTATLPGFFAAKLGGARYLYHNHDVTPVTRQFGLYPFLKWFERWSSRRADLVVFPQMERGEIFAQESSLVQKPTIVLNGPRIDWAKDAIMDSDIALLKEKYPRLVLYQGGLNWMRGLGNVIKSMPLWPKDVACVMVGGADLQPSFPKEARELANKLGVGDKLLLKDTMGYLDLPSITAYCDIGLGVLATDKEDDSHNIRFLAGASNKLAEYMACGLPAVVPDNQQYRVFILEPGVGKLVDPADAQSLATAIKELLDTERYERVSARAEQYFVTTLNFDTQFKPVLDVVASH